VQYQRQPVHQEQDYSKVGDMKNKIQMVDDDQVENVGIMSGFMDDLEGLLEELSAEEMEGMEEGDEADMARTMKRSPDSPEILMNNLRGDMRSIDARREELSDLVGFREAEETPEGVLALLQPILGQQAAPMMPPQGMPPMPPQGMPAMPPQGMPPMMPPQGMPPQQLAAGGPVGYADGGAPVSQLMRNIASQGQQEGVGYGSNNGSLITQLMRNIASQEPQADVQARAEAQARTEAQALQGLLGREAQAAAEARAAQTPEYQQAQARAEAQAMAGLFGREAQAAAEARAAQTPEYQQAQAIADAQAQADAMAGLFGREAQAAAEARAAQTPEYQQAQAIADARARADAQAQAQARADAQAIAEAQAMAGLLGREAQAAAEARAAQTPEYQQAQAIADARARADAQAQADAQGIPPQGTRMPMPPMGARESMPISPDDAAIRDLLLQQGQQVAPPVAGPATGGIGSLPPTGAPVGGINDEGIMRRMQEEQQRRMMEEQQRRMMEEQQRRMMEEQQPRMMEERLPMPPYDPRLPMPPYDPRLPMPPYDPRLPMPPYDPRLPMPPMDDGTTIGYDPRPQMPPVMPPMDESMPPMDDGTTIGYDPRPPMMPVGTPVDQRPMFAPQRMPAFSPPPDSGVGALFAPANAPRFMADGGMVQHFQDGSGEAGVTPSGTYSPEIIAEALKRLQGSAVPTVQEGMARNLPMYQEILGSDPSNTQAQMLFDIGQAALGFAGNVGPDGQPLRGSAAARLAGATRELPGRIGARAAAMDQEKQGIRLAALQASQAERDAALKAQGERFVTLTPEEIEAEGLDPVYTWQRSPLTGELKTLGSRPRVPDNVTVTSGETYAEGVAKLSAQDDATLVKNATGATNNIAKLDEALALINSGNVNLGIGSELATNFDRVKAQFLNDSEAQRRVSTDQYLDALLGSDVFSAIGSLGIGARGLDTPAEREFLRLVLTGTRGLTADGLTRITELRRDREINILKEYNNRVELGELDAFFDASNKVKRQFEIPPLPSFTPSGPNPSETAEEALARRKRREEGAG
jgi:hypothetical protein